MNFYKIYIAIAFIIIGSACNRKLDLPTDGRITADQIFIDQNRTMGYLNSCYGYVPPPYIDRASYSDEAHDADDIVSGSRIGQWYAGTVTAQNYSGISADGSPWGQLYEGINKCNTFLTNIDGAKIYVSDEIKKGWKAQAFTLRALYYLQLIKRYGGVPIFEKPLGVAHDFSKDVRAKFGDVVKFIVKDCDSALAAPNTRDGFSWNIYANQFGIMTRAVPYAIKSQAMLYAASPLWNDGTFTWADATAATAEALQQCLANDYKLYDQTPSSDIAQNAYTVYFLNSSNDQRSQDKETIYQAGNQLDIWRDAGLPTNIGQIKAGPCPSQELVDAYEMANGLAPINGYADASHLQPIINNASGYNETSPYVNRDPRFYGSIYYNGAPTSLNSNVVDGAVRFTTTDVLNGVEALCPSWGDAVGNLSLSIYKWSNSFAETVTAPPLVKKLHINFPDNSWLNVTFPTPAPPGEYLLLFSDGTQEVGVWKSTVSTHPAQSYFRGQPIAGDYIVRILYPSGTVDLYNQGWNDATQFRGSAPRSVETYVGGKEGISTQHRQYTRTGYYIRKFNNYKSTQGSNADGSIRLFRLAELYLNFAEAANNSVGADVPVTAIGKSMTAREAVNAVRTRAGMPGFASGMSKADFEKKYRNERRIELAFEEHRFFDVRRWKVLQETDKFVTGMRIANTGNAFTYNRFKLLDRNCWDTKWLMYAIDQSEVDKVFGYTGVNWQNPGW